MSKHKIRDLQPWLTTEEPILERGGNVKQRPFLQMSSTVMKDPRFSALTPSERLLYLCMATEAKNKQSFKFPLQTALCYGISESSLRRGVNALEKAGFIECIANERTERLPNIYKFTPHIWKNRAEPEHKRVNGRAKDKNGYIKMV